MADYDLDMEILAAVTNKPGGEDGAGVGGGSGNDSDSSDDFDDGGDAGGDDDDDDDDDEDADGDSVSSGDDDERGLDGGDDDDDDGDKDDDDFDGVAASKIRRRRHPDDPGLGPDDDDDNDDDDDDDDYEGAAVKAKRKRAAAAAAKAKEKKGKASVKKSKKGTAGDIAAEKKKKKSATATKKKGASGAKRNPKGTKATADDSGDDDGGNRIFEYKYDEQGYGDSDDREYVSAMNEIDRETLLAERVEERQREEKLWTLSREMNLNKNKSSAANRAARSTARGAKASKTAAAIGELAADKAAKRASANRRDIGVISDDDSEEDGERGERRRRGADEAEIPQDEDEMYAGDGPDMTYDDLVVTPSCLPVAPTMSMPPRDLMPTHLFLPRDKLTELVSEPYFARSVTGLFVRFRTEFRGGASGYILCTISSISQVEDKPYKLSDHMGKVTKRTNKYLNVKIADQEKREISIELCSNSVPTKAEFDVYTSRLNQFGKRHLMRQDVVALFDSAKKMTSARTKPEATPEELAAHHANNAILFPESTNWTIEKTKVGAKLVLAQESYDVAKRGDDQDVVDAALTKLDEVRAELVALEAKAGGKQTGRSQDIWQAVARKNNAVNNVNERLAASRRALETTVGGIDPFARFDTTGMSYFSIKQQKSTGGDVDVGAAPNLDGTLGAGADGRPLRGGADDWKLTLRSWTSKEGGRRPMGNKPLVPVYGTAFVGLDDFQRTPAELNELYPTGPVLLPPSIDALYAHQVRLTSDLSSAPSGKAITLDEYNSQ
jgi:Plus-3 domain